MFADVFPLQGGTLRRGEVRTPARQFKSIRELAIEVLLFKRHFFGLALPGQSSHIIAGQPKGFKFDGVGCSECGHLWISI